MIQNVNWEKKKNHYLLYQNWMVLHLNKFESASPKDTLCQVWLVLEKNFFFLISSMYFCYLLIISPWKRAGPFIWTNLNSLYPRMLVPSLVEIGPVVLEKKLKKKSLRQRHQQRQHQRRQRQQQRRRRTPDKFWSEKLTWAFGSGELKSTFFSKTKAMRIKVLKYCKPDLNVSPRPRIIPSCICHP